MQAQSSPYSHGITTRRCCAQMALTIPGSHLASPRGAPLLSLRLRVLLHPQTRLHAELLGPCFKTGRVSDQRVTEQRSISSPARRTTRLPTPPTQSCEQSSADDTDTTVQLATKTAYTASAESAVLNRPALLSRTPVANEHTADPRTRQLHQRPILAAKSNWS